MVSIKVDLVPTILDTEHTGPILEATRVSKGQVFVYTY